MSSFVLIEGFQYTELDVKGQRKVLNWLDEHPMDYEDDEGNIRYDYPSDWATIEVQEHCEMNEYLFDRYGEPIHHLVLTEHRIKEEINNDNDNT